MTQPRSPKPSIKFVDEYCAIVTVLPPVNGYIVCSTYLMVSLHSSVFHDSHSYILQIFAEHSLWNKNYGWKNILNNLRLIVQPFVLFNLIKPWLKVFSIPKLSLGFSYLINIMNTLHNHLFLSLWSNYFSFSSA